MSAPEARPLVREPAELVDALGMPHDEAAVWLAAFAWTSGAVASIRAALAPLDHPGISVLAVGSLGRGEASPRSDLDLVVVHDDTPGRAEQATRLRTAAITTLTTLPTRVLDVPQKTFVRPYGLGELVRNVGGRLDTNEGLTHRALLLTERVWLTGPDCAELVAAQIFRAYSSGPSTRGRVLTALANDLHRYYRTVCVDYRHKVEEQDKAWAIRSLKLKRSRKLWHLANIALQTFAALTIDGEDRDAFVFARLCDPPLLRVGQVALALGFEEAMPPMIRLHDRLLVILGDAERRLELETLRHDTRHTSATWRAIDEDNRAFDAACGAYVRALIDRAPDDVLRVWLL
jgi:predicted nucleotidyltransferase